MKKRAAIYARVSTGEQHLETQLLDLREMAKQRGYEVAHEIHRRNFRCEVETSWTRPSDGGRSTTSFRHRARCCV
jgi:DNA invertase Pin-like site-specific DNA recombinase